MYNVEYTIKTSILNSRLLFNRDVDIRPLFATSISLIYISLPGINRYTNYLVMLFCHFEFVNITKENNTF